MPERQPVDARRHAEPDYFRSTTAACSWCGAVVEDQGQHTDWHNYLTEMFGGVDINEGLYDRPDVEGGLSVTMEGETHG